MCNLDNFKWAAANLTAKEVKGKRVLDIGSYDVNGSLRYVIEMLEPSEYMGTDISEGPGVDKVCPADKLLEEFGENSFDLVISTSALEHIREWRDAVSNIKRVCKPGGLIILSMPSRWPFHEYPYDYWRYGISDMEEIFKDCKILKLERDSSRMSQMYAKIEKPRKFNEVDISEYELYSVVAGKRVKAIENKHFKTLRFRFIALRGKIWKFFHVKGNRLLSYGNPCYPRNIDEVT